MNVSEYIVCFLKSKKVNDVFGYPGGMVTYLMDALEKEKNMKAHLLYHEQSASFAACGYAQVTGKMGMSYATSGPGATNLVTGIANAFFDSIPVLFITGQVNTEESKKNLLVRQKGFQEMDIVSMVKGITKYAVKIENENDILKELNKAYELATSGRKGPVLIDIPIDISRKEISNVNVFEENERVSCQFDGHELVEKLIKSTDRIVLLVGNGAVNEENKCLINKIAIKFKIPVVSSMLAIDILPGTNDNYYGFIGVYGSRVANTIIEHSELIISVGSRLDVRQTGTKIESFAKSAKLIRVDIDEYELENKIKLDEISIRTDASSFLKWLNTIETTVTMDWSNKCREARRILEDVDRNDISEFIEKFSEQVTSDCVITTDVGQNQVWVAQHFKVKCGQKILFSGGHATMGYAIPSAIGAYYASGKKVLSICGDGGFLMNMQELLFISSKRIPVTIVIFNNKSLGMIRHFQELYFNKNYFQTTMESGFDSLNYKAVAEAFGIKYEKRSLNEYNDFKLEEVPKIVEVVINAPTYITPKLLYGDSLDRQEPYLNEIISKAIDELFGATNV